MKDCKMFLISICLAVLASTGALSLNVSVPFIDADDVWNLGIKGNGVKVGQVEVKEPDKTHAAFGGRVTVKHTAPTIKSGHPTQVAGVILSGNAVYKGVAPEASIYAFGYNVPVNPAQPEAALAAQTCMADQGTPILNFSFGEEPVVGGTTNGEQLLSLFVDWAAYEKKVLTCIAGNEDGIPIPTDAYNGMTVAATELHPDYPNKYWRVAKWNSPNTTSDERHKPDIVAPGNDIASTTLPAPAFSDEDFNDLNGDGVWDRTYKEVNGVPGFQARDPFLDKNNNGTRDADEIWIDSDGDGVFNHAGDYYLAGASEPVNDLDSNKVWTRPVSGTSFSAPHVSGTAALLTEYGTKNGLKTNPLVLKAVMMNSADKIKTMNYLGLNWIQSEAYANTYIPTDHWLGSGQLNALTSYNQYTPGEKAPGNVPKTAWDYGTYDPNAANKPKYTLNNGANLKKGQVICATLVWNRHVALDADNDGDGEYDIGDTFKSTSLQDLDIKLLDGNDNVLVRSCGVKNNVEEIFYRVPSDGVYKLELYGSTVTNNEDYTLAWNVLGGTGGVDLAEVKFFGSFKEQVTLFGTTLENEDIGRITTLNTLAANNTCNRSLDGTNIKLIDEGARIEEIDGLDMIYDKNGIARKFVMSARSNGTTVYEGTDNDPPSVNGADIIVVNLDPNITKDDYRVQRVFDASQNNAWGRFKNAEFDPDNANVDALDWERDADMHDEQINLNTLSSFYGSFDKEETIDGNTYDPIDVFKCTWDQHNNEWNIDKTFDFSDIVTNPNYNLDALDVKLDDADEKLFTASFESDGYFHCIFGGGSVDFEKEDILAFEFRENIWHVGLYWDASLYGYDGNVSLNALDDSSIHVTDVIPEPGTIVLIGLGVMAVAGIVRKRLR